MSSFHRHRSVASIAFFVSACSSPPIAEISVVEIESELTARAAATAATRRSADPWDGWSACLETSAPTILAARHRLAAVTARARAAGRAPVMVEGEQVGFGADRTTELMAAFDLARLVGSGRGAAEQARAELVVEAAAAELAAARFHTQHDLERALARLAVARTLATDLEAFTTSLAPAERRAALLDQRGWLAPDDLAATRLKQHHLAAHLAEQSSAVAAARAELAAVSGLPGDSAWLDDPEATGLLTIERHADGRLEPDASQPPEPAALLATHPDLARDRIALLAAEADVRLAAAERWPALLIGPKASLTPDDLLWGGVLRLELPWPSAADAELDAARAERDGERAQLVAAFTRACNAVVAQRAAADAADRVRRTHGESLLADSEITLRAAQARFMADPAALRDWTMAIEARHEALVAHADALERWLVTLFDASEAEGRS